MSPGGKRLDGLETDVENRFSDGAVVQNRRPTSYQQGGGNKEGRKEGNTQENLIWEMTARRITVPGPRYVIMSTIPLGIKQRRRCQLNIYTDRSIGAIIIGGHC